MAGAAADHGALIGRRLGDFSIVKPLSGGGFGMVFLAQQEGLDRQAVIKVLHRHHTGNPSVAARFLREAKLASLLDHPYAAHIYAFGAEPDGVLWIAMELVRGTTLDALLKVQGPIPLERFAPFFARMCEVVQTAHEKGLVHRDLKPANVMVLSRAGQLLPKLLDFGIAKLTSAGADDPPEPAEAPRPADIALTGKGVTMGSPHYMAPEQWRDSAATDARSDVYALGVIAFQALTGEPPFRGHSRELVHEQHLAAPVPPLGAGFPSALDAVLARALAKRQAERYQSALELATAFRTASGLGEQAAPPQLDAALREAMISRAPQPLALAVAALEAARNAHQARDAMWQVVRVSIRLVASVALACHAQVGSDAAASDPAVGAALLRLRQRELTEADWLEVARELVRRFAGLRDAHPMPELVTFLVDGDARVLDELCALRASADSAGSRDDRVAQILERGLELTARALRALEFLLAYPLVIPHEDPDTTLREGPGRAPAGGASAWPAEVWMGARAGPRRRGRVFGHGLVAGRPVLIDAGGAPIVSLWPFVQAREPNPEADRTLFFFDGTGRRGARMVALPDPFEVEDDQLRDSLGALLEASSDTSERPAAETRRPYPGLAAFTDADAASFFGRERDTEAFVNRLRVQPLLVVTGPSGAGKSSFVQAGVLPALPSGWRAIVARPGPAPLAGLAARLAATGVATGDLDLAADPASLGEALRAGAADGAALVLVVDQLEELFTLCDDPEERAVYADALAGAAHSAADPVRVVMTLRDDFLSRAGALPGLRARLSLSLQILTTPAERDLRRILVEPLTAVGYRFDDPALPDEMVSAVAGTAAPLALLSFTASRLWDLRDRAFRSIGRKAYDSLGGVAGALAQHAEEVLTAMPSEEQRLVREVFRHAVTAEGTRAALSPSELLEALGGSPPARAVIEKLLAARLLVVADSELGERIEIAHETLLEAWPRLVDWRREDAEGARLRDALRAAARRWDERGRSSDLLWRGDSLAEYQLWRGRSPGGLTAAEEAFAAASLAEAARGRRARRLGLGAALLALSAVAIALLFLNGRAERQRELAVTSKGEAERSADNLKLLLRGQYEDQGRRLVLAGDPLQGLAFLAEAGDRGVRGAAHDLLVAQAVRATDGELFSVRHEHMVARVRFSPDGSRLATVGYDHVARLWNAGDGSPLATLTHDEGVVRVAFSAAGDRLVTGATDGVVKIWRVTDGGLVHTLRVAGAAQALEFSPDGALVAAVSATDEVTLWSAISGQLVARLVETTGGEDTPRGSPCGFSPDGTRLAAGSRAGIVRVWDVRTRRPVATLSGHRENVTTVRFSPEGRRLVSAGMDDAALVWQLDSSRPIAVLPHRHDVNSAAFSPDGRLVVTASADKTAAVWEVETGRSRFLLEGHVAAVNSAIFSPDGSMIATISDDMTARLWDAVTGEELARRLGHAAALRDMAFSPDGKRLATASLDRSAIVWTTTAARLATRLPGHRAAITGVDIAPDGHHLATSSRDGSARVWDASTGRELLRLPHDQPTDVLYSPDGERIATAGEDRSVKLWDARTGAELVALTGHQEEVQSLSWHPAGDLIASAGSGAVRIWSSRTGELVRELRTPGGRIVFGVAFAPSGTQLLTAGEDNVARLWELATGREVARFEDRGRHAPAFDRRGERVLSVTPTAARIWRLADGAIAAELVGHIGGVLDAGWSADDRMVVTAGIDGTARIWDAESGSLLAVFRHRGQVSAVRSAPDGRFLVTATLDGRATVWELPRWIGSRQELDRVLRCRVPYQVVGERLVSRPRDPTACAHMAPREADH